MSNTVETNPSEYQDVPRATLRWSLLVVLLSFAALVMTVLLSANAPALQSTLLKLSLIFTLVSSVVASFLLFKNRLTIGLILLLSTLIIEAFILSIYIQSISFLFLLVTVPITIFIVSENSNQKSKIPFIQVSVAVGILAIVSDLFFGNSGFRFQFPDNYEPLLFVVTAIILLVDGILFARKYRSFSMRTKLVVSFVLVTIFSLGLVGYLNDRNTRIALTNEASESLFAAAQQTQDSLLDFINNTQSSVTNEANLPVFRDFLRLPSALRTASVEEARVRETLSALLGKDEEHISSYALLDTSGITLADTQLEDIGLDRSNRKYFQNVLESGESYFSDMIISPVTGQASIYFSSPIVADQFVGVLRVRYDASILQELLERSNNLVGEDSFGVLFDENFIHLAHGFAPETIFTSITPLTPEVFSRLVLEGRMPNQSPESLFHDLFDLEGHLITAQASADGIEFFEATDVATGERVLQAVAIEFDEPPWLLVFFQPEDIFLAPALAQSQVLIVLSLVIAGVAVLVGLGLAQLLSKPIEELTLIAEKVSLGDLSAQANISGDDEIATLASSFNSMTTQIRALVEGLEVKVAERTKDLNQRATDLEAAAQIARDATSEKDLEILLIRAVNLTRSHFDYVYVGIYLTGTRKEKLYLRAGTGKTGQELLEKRQRIEINETSAIGRVVMNGEPEIVPEPDTNEKKSSIGMLAETRIQLIVPLRVGEDILGAFEFQSRDENAFGENDVALLQTLADQIANATQKTSLRTEVEDTLRELESAYGQLSQSAWRDFGLKEGRAIGYQYDQREIKKIGEQTEETIQVWNEKKIVSINGKQDGTSTLAVPVTLRGEVIGVLNLQFDEEQVPTNSRLLFEDLASRLGLVMENARLLETTQNRVERQRLLSEITARMRETLDIDEILQTSVKEIGKRFGIRDVEIRLGSIGKDFKDSDVDSLPEILNDSLETAISRAESEQK